MLLGIVARDGHFNNQQTVKALRFKNNTMTKRQQWEMFTSYVQTVLLLQPHTLEVSFATL